MSTEERKMFDLMEQQRSDIFTVVKIISPVIPLISEWGKAEREYEKVCGEVKKISKEIKTIKDALEILSGDQIIEALNVALKEKCDAHNQLYKKREELKQVCDNFEIEVIEYQNYAKMFEGWMSTNNLDRMDWSKLKTQKQCFAILFLGFHAAKHNRSAVLTIKANLARKNFNGDILQNEWNYMLKYLKNN